LTCACGIQNPASEGRLDPAVWWTTKNYWPDERHGPFFVFRIPVDTRNYFTGRQDLPGVMARQQQEMLQKIQKLQQQICHHWTTSRRRRARVVACVK